MKKLFAIVLVLILLFALTGCNNPATETGSTPDTSSTESVDNTSSEVESEVSSEEPVSSQEPTSSEEVSSTKPTTPTTPTTPAGPTEVEIKGNFQYNVDYVGCYKEYEGALTCIEIRVDESDPDYIVITTYYYAPYKEGDDYYVEYNGKKWCGEGGGHSPYLVEFKEKQIVAKEMGTEIEVATFALLSNGELKATYSSLDSFDEGATFKVGGKLKPVE